MRSTTEQSDAIKKRDQKNIVKEQQLNQKSPVKVAQSLKAASVKKPSAVKSQKPSASKHVAASEEKVSSKDSSDDSNIEAAFGVPKGESNEEESKGD